MVESVDTADSKSASTRVLYEFESRPGYARDQFTFPCLRAGSFRILCFHRTLRDLESAPPTSACSAIPARLGSSADTDVHRSFEKSSVKDTVGLFGDDADDGRMLVSCAV